MVSRRRFFATTQTVTSTKFINAPVDVTIAALHDFPLMINLNPLVTSSTPDTEYPNVYTVTDKIKLFLGLSMGTSYTAKFEAVENGMNTDTAASAGVKLRNEWRAVPGVNGGTELTETDRITSHFLLSPFVISQLKTSHDKLFNTLAAKLEGAI